MRRWRTSGLVTSLALSAWALLAAPRQGAAAERDPGEGFAPPTPTRINGSGSALDMMKPLLRAYSAAHPQDRMQMNPPLGSSGANAGIVAAVLVIGLPTTYFIVAYKATVGAMEVRTILAEATRPPATHDGRSERRT
jgi:hypothetical protein